MKNLISGQNIGLESLTLNAQFVSNIIGYKSHEILAIHAFMLGSNGHTPERQAFISTQCPRHSSDCLKILPEMLRYKLDLTKTPVGIEKIVLTATIHQPAIEKNLTFGAGVYAGLILRNSEVRLRFRIDTTGMSESALIMGEFYRRNHRWKFRAIGQGFKRGLKPMLAYFGVEERIDCDVVSGGFSLNEALIKTREVETKQVTKMLDDIFAEQNQENINLVVKPVVSSESVKNPLLNLDAAHQSFLNQLLTQEVWERSVVYKMCKELNLMANGAMEILNEWALEYADIALLEESDRVYVDVELAREIVNA